MPSASVDLAHRLPCPPAVHLSILGRERGNRRGRAARQHRHLPARGEGALRVALENVDLRHWLAVRVLRRPFGRLHSEVPPDSGARTRGEGWTSVTLLALVPLRPGDGRGGGSAIERRTERPAVGWDRRDPGWDCLAPRSRGAGHLLRVRRRCLPPPAHGRGRRRRRDAPGPRLWPAPRWVAAGPRGGRVCGGIHRRHHLPLRRPFRDPRLRRPPHPPGMERLQTVEVRVGVLKYGNHDLGEEKLSVNTNQSPWEEVSMSPKKDTQKSAKSTTATSKKFKGFTDEERAAMQEYVQEMKASAQRGARREKAGGERALLAKIAEMQEPDRAMAKRLHAIIKTSAPALSPRTWYGMPAYAKDGEVVCFFQPAQKFKTRYATLGFSDAANLDEGATWPVAFALKALTAAEEARISMLVRKAVSED